jgi:hypothetical protein
MALTYNQLAAVTQDLYIPKMVENIFDSNALLQRAKAKWYRSADGGTKIIEPLLYATTTAVGWYTGADTLSTTDNEQMTAAEFDWKQIYANITITRLDELKNSGKSRIVDFVGAKVQAAEKTLKDTMGTGMFNAGTTTNAIIGLRGFISTSKTYGGISQSTYSWWQAQVDSTTTVLSIPALQAITGDCTIDNDKPTVYITTQDILDDYHSLLQPQERFQDDTTADGGFSNLLFHGKPIIVDSHCPSGDLYALNENYLNLRYHPQENFRFEPFIKPTNQNVSTAKVYWTGALTCNNVRMQGTLGALT